jgi:hypothetical protein
MVLTQVFLDDVEKEGAIRAMAEKSDAVESKAVYFTNYPDRHPGAWKRSRANTDECCRLAVRRAKELGIRQMVIASDTGHSAVRLMEAVKREGLTNVRVVVEAGTYGELGPNSVGFDPKNRRRLEGDGVKIVFATSPFTGLSRAVRWRYGGIEIAELIAAVYKTISEGFKVAVEIAMTCADTGDLAVGEECVAIGGTSRGADTAVVLTPCNSFAFFDGRWGMKIHEVICMPRCRTPRPPSAFDYSTHKGRYGFISYSP